MRTRTYSALLLLFCFCISYGQMVRTSHGPNIYINPVIVKENKIKNLSFVEYSISGGKKKMIDKYDILFDTSGKPTVRSEYTLKRKSNAGPFRKPDTYDTVIYDNNRNMVRVKSNKNFEYIYKYDDKNREVYFFAIDYAPQGPHFSVTNYQYDPHSRIISSDTRTGKGTDITKADTHYITDYTYDNIKLLDVTEKKMARDKNGQESEAFETKYSFEYNRGVLKRVYANTTLNGVEIDISQNDKKNNR